jgi:hypothetical protein
VPLPTERLAAGDHHQAGVQLCDHIAQPGVGRRRAAFAIGSAHQGFVGVQEHHVGLLALGPLLEVFGEQVGDGFFQSRETQTVEFLEDRVVAYPVGADGAARTEVEQPGRGAEDRDTGGVVEDFGQDLAVLGQRQRVRGQAQMRVHALPQHRAGDVEAVELDLLRAELDAQHGEPVRGLPMARHLQIEHRRRMTLLDPRPQFGDQPGLADPADTVEQHDPGMLIGVGQQFLEPRQDRLTVDERTTGRSRLESCGQHHGVSPLVTSRARFCQTPLPLRSGDRCDNR